MALWNGSIVVLGADKADASATKDILGNKGYNLHRMLKWGVRVPAAVAISADACRMYMQSGGESQVAELVMQALPAIRKALTRSLSASKHYMPLVSVRSSAAVSMPGMMDTILNVGLDQETYPFWKKRLGEKTANDCACRLVKMYGTTVDGLSASVFDGCNDPDAYLGCYFSATDKEFPSGDQQLLGAILAVLRSWNTPRAREYRRMNGIPENLGTAVIIQEMVFGNLKEKSCTGVLFTRNPYTGENAIVGDFLVGHQGEDVVDGSHTPTPLTVFKQAMGRAVSSALWAQVQKLEELTGYPQEVEFTVQEGETYILQTRDAKPSPAARIRIALDMHEEGALTLEQVFASVSFTQFLKASAVVIGKHAPDPHATGLPASAGVACGVVVATVEDALKCNEPCILVRPETCPDDIKGMAKAVGILTQNGGFTCHAAVVARSMNKVCVVGCSALTFGMLGEDGVVMLNGHALNGKKITIDGLTGRVWVSDEVPMGSAGSKEAARLYQLALEKYPYVELIDRAPIEVGPEPVMFSCAVFVRKYPDADLLSEVGKLLSLPFTHLVLDLTAWRSDVEDIFGKMPYFNRFGLDSVLAKVASVQGPAPQRFSLFGLPQDVVSFHGCEVIRSVSTLAGLLSAEGLIAPDADALSQIGAAEVAQIVRLKRKAGETIQSFSVLRDVPPSQWPRGAVVASSALNFMKAVLS